MTLQTTQRSRIPLVLVITAALVGVLLGTFEIANTSVGWHLAGGRWVIENSSVPFHDPFAYSSESVEWVDHEWLFQTGAALIHRYGGGEALSLARSLVIAALAVLLFVIGCRSGLSPPVALALSAVCIAGARPRFFLRPELVTLVVVPAAVWIFLGRDRHDTKFWLPALAAVMIVGANAHGGALVVPILLTGILAAAFVEMAVLGKWRPETLASGLLGIVTATTALLVNPYGWRLFAVPFRLTALVDQPHIPNPEWIPPTLRSWPMLFAVVIIATLILAIHERQNARWSLFIMAVALAMRHIRNLGLFFVLLPLAIAPSLARWKVLSDESDDPRVRRRTRALAACAVLVLAASIAASPWPRFGLGFADNYYPTLACDFIDAENLPQTRLYNDVLFGGYLINRYGPDRGVFLDDRNEIHDELLREIWEIFSRSDVKAWSGLLERYEIDTALVRYHAPIMVTQPDGTPLGERGFSALWFPTRDWALIYWDETAMVFVRRSDARGDLLTTHEYSALRPDDLAYLQNQLEADPGLLERVVDEVGRALKQNPENGLALRLDRYLADRRDATGL